MKCEMCKNWEKASGCKNPTELALYLKEITI